MKDPTSSSNSSSIHTEDFLTLLASFPKSVYISALRLLD